MNKYLLGAGILAILLILVSLSFSNSDTNTNTQVASAVSVVEDAYDFGEIDIFGGKVQTTYTLKNEGMEDVLITSAVTSCMCTEGEIGDLTFGMHESTGKTVVIPAGEGKTLTATFDPLAHGPNGTGKIKRELMLKTNSTVTPDIKVTFSGNVIKNEVE
ncbi:MAG: DUF1573 domain-containing protein [Candidatus Paceibacterota bacterium]